MPQISKIRIVNISYNDGKRFIPDELYDLEMDSKEALNSLFNLNNGGGKTVLVQLMMQPINPKAMAGGRHIEDYFTRQGDHGYILIEWTTDGSKEKLLTGIAIAANNSNQSDEDKRGNSIKYYTFKTVYEGYSQYSISSLELSKNENGKYVPASFDYIREKAKNSKGAIQIFSSDNSVKWAEELSNYGIEKSEWKTVIEPLNKDEGGLNQFFDEAKTSEKLITKFFIPAIEDKMNSAAKVEKDNSLETMLINYAKKISEKELVIKEHDTNKKLLENLTELSEASDKLYNINDELVKEIEEACGLKAAILKRIKIIERDIEIAEDNVKKKNDLIRHIEYEKNSKDYYEALGKYEDAAALYEEAKIKLEECKVALDNLEHKEDVIRCAELYSQVKEIEGRIAELNNLISEKENNSDDAERIQKLKYSVLVKADKKAEELKNKKKTEEKSLSEQQIILNETQKRRDSKLQEYKKAEQDYYDKNTWLKKIQEDTDRLLEKLDIDAIRQFDGFYQVDELEAEREKKVKEQSKSETERSKLNSQLESLEKRLEEIQERKPALEVEARQNIERKESITKELAEYEKLYKILQEYCVKYSIEDNAIFTGDLRNRIRIEYEEAIANINKSEYRKQELEEKLKAAKKGYVHIIPRIKEYVDSTGISYQTGEGYLCGLLDAGNMSLEDVNRVLDKYPEVAYALIFYTEKDLEQFLKAGNAEWFQAIVPLLTMEQIDRILKNEADKINYLAVWDRGYFADRDGYCNKLEKDINEYENQIVRYRSNKAESENEKKLIEKFEYDADFRESQEKEIERLNDKINETAKSIRELENELTQVKASKEETKTSIAECNENLNIIKNWLEKYAELSSSLDREDNMYNEVQEAFSKKQSVQSSLKEAEADVKAAEEKILAVKDNLKVTEDNLKPVMDMLTKVGNATETEIIDGELEGLYAQYNTLYDNMSEDLAKLKEKLDKAVEDKKDSEKALHIYDDKCQISEYESLKYSLELLENIKSKVSEAKKNKEQCQDNYDACNREYSSCKARLEASQNGLAEYEGMPLPKNEIGDDFVNRKNELNREIKQVNEQKRELDIEKRQLERVSDNLGTILDEYEKVENPKNIELSHNPKEQADQIKYKINDTKKLYEKEKTKLCNSIRDTVNEYKDISIAEIVIKLDEIKNMLVDDGIKGDRLYTVSESIGIMITSIEKINRQIETDLQEIENDFNDIVNQCMIQGKKMYQDLKAIVNSSRVHIFEGKPQTQMVKMDLPDEKEISEEASRIAMKNEIESGANEIKAYIKDGKEEKEILKRAKKIVSSHRLLLRYIKQDEIQIKVYKIDMNAENSGYKRWEDALTQSSGAEKFVVFFSVVLTLMNYNKSASGIISKNTKSVLILDNPFGKITSAHLLKPMFDIAKHFNVQLICFSDINKSDVINCFDCVIKLVIKNQNCSNYEIMTHEGNEVIEHGYYKIMNGQMSLF